MEERKENCLMRNTKKYPIQSKLKLRERCGALSAAVTVLMGHSRSFQSRHGPGANVFTGL